jgi:hypothetical protein
MREFIAAIAMAFLLACAGTDGAMGPIGNTGPAGNDGAPGAAGSPGKDGSQGAPATIDTAEFISRIVAQIPAAQKGEKGDKGDQGEPGAAGATGSPGAKGDKGDPGAAGGIVGNVIEGDLIVKGRICVFYGSIGSTPLRCQTPAQVQLFGEGAAVFFASNLDGAQFQSPMPHGGVVSLDPDGGLRLGNNVPWNNPFYDPARPIAFSGFDSQNDWSWYRTPVGAGELGAQSLVLKQDWDAKEMYFASHLEGWKIGARTSSSGCKWCENLRWTFPTQ